MLVERQKDTTTPVNVFGVQIGGKELVVMAGPCSVDWWKLNPLPASTGLQARLCREDLLIEIEAIAVNES